ncbi:hypothetical protein PLICRDRAFT_633657 [Plicaturopsis crispa FD-325 SS-3]|nr:hypothetical protein PLICRDRAFT_633657 [Plicaturopsis crispa FD-325 SS-3]
MLVKPGSSSQPRSRHSLIPRRSAASGPNMYNRMLHVALQSINKGENADSLRQAMPTLQEVDGLFELSPEEMDQYEWMGDKYISSCLGAEILERYGGPVWFLTAMLQPLQSNRLFSKLMHVTGWAKHAQLHGSRPTSRKCGADYFETIIGLFYKIHGEVKTRDLLLRLFSLSIQAMKSVWDEEHPEVALNRPRAISILREPAGTTHCNSKPLPSTSTQTHVIPPSKSAQSVDIIPDALPDAGELKGLAHAIIERGDHEQKDSSYNRPLSWSDESVSEDSPSCEVDLGEDHIPVPTSLLVYATHVHGRLTPSFPDQNSVEAPIGHPGLSGSCQNNLPFLYSTQRPLANSCAHNSTIRRLCQAVEGHSMVRSTNLHSTNSFESHPPQSPRSRYVPKYIGPWLDFYPFQSSPPQDPTFRPTLSPACRAIDPDDFDTINDIYWPNSPWEGERAYPGYWIPDGHWEPERPSRQRDMLGRRVFTVREALEARRRHRDSPS